MKHIFVAFLSTAILLIGTGCKDGDSRYVDLNTGRTLSMTTDEHGLLVDADTKKPIYIYVDTQKHDTIYGVTGKVINGDVKLEDGKYTYAGEESQVKMEDMKIKVEKDGDVKIKDDDGKVKIDGKTGEMKSKKD
jgi:hypothetical protein